MEFPPSSLKSLPNKPNVNTVSPDCWTALRLRAPANCREPVTRGSALKTEPCVGLELTRIKTPPPLSSSLAAFAFFYTFLYKI